MALKTDLIGVWCEGADPVTDQHTNGLTLTNNNTVAAVAGLVGTAGDFERDNTASLSRPDEALLSTGDIDFTLAAWVQLETLATNRFLCSKGVEFRVFTTATRFRATSDSAVATANTFGQPALATWQYVQVQHDATNNKLRIRVNDGAWDESPTSGAGPTDDVIPFAIGGVSSGGAPGLTWDGLINQCAFWKALKSDADLNEIYNAGAGLAFSAWDVAPPVPSHADTAQKRYSLLGLGSPVPRVLPIPQGSVAADDRAMRIFLYSGFFDTEGAVEPEPEAAETFSGGWRRKHAFQDESDSDRQARIKAERVRMGILPPDDTTGDITSVSSVSSVFIPPNEQSVSLAAHLLPEDLAGLEALAARAAELTIEEEIKAWLGLVRLQEQRRLHEAWLRDEDDAAVLILAIATIH